MAHGCQLTDVTLACEGRQLDAHQVLLAAASPFFCQLLKVAIYYYYCFLFLLPAVKGGYFFCQLLKVAIYSCKEMLEVFKKKLCIVTVEQPRFDGSNYQPRVTRNSYIYILTNLLELFRTNLQHKKKMQSNQVFRTIISIYSRLSSGI